MPSAPLRPCPVPLCPHLVSRHGLCPQHSRERQHQQRSAAQRGYDARWVRFRRWWVNELRRLDIVPACGARLPGAPLTTHSTCAAQGRLNVERLQLDHIRPHRGDKALMYDPLCI